MKDHEGDNKQYSRVSSPSSEGLVDEVHFGFYGADGESTGEMTMCWYATVIPGHAPTPFLEVSMDGWHALAQFKDMIDALAEVDDEDISPKVFCQLLDRCGFVDATKRKEQE